MYNLSISAANPTIKTEANNSVQFITKVPADLQYFTTSTKIWEWANRTTNKFNY